MDFSNSTYHAPKASAPSSPLRTTSLNVGCSDNVNIVEPTPVKALKPPPGLCSLTRARFLKDVMSTCSMEEFCMLLDILEQPIGRARVRKAKDIAARATKKRVEGWLAEAAELGKLAEAAAAAKAKAAAAATNAKAKNKAGFNKYPAWNAPL